MCDSSFTTKKGWKDTIYWSMKEWKISNVIFVMLALHKRPTWMDTWHQFMKEKSLSNAAYMMLALQKKGSWIDFDSRGYLNKHVAFMKVKCLQMQNMRCKLYKNGTDPNLKNCSYLKEGSHNVCTVDTSLSKHKNVHSGENTIPIWRIVVIVKEGSLITYWKTFCYFYITIYLTWYSQTWL